MAVSVAVVDGLLFSGSPSRSLAAEASPPPPPSFVPTPIGAPPPPPSPTPLPTVPATVSTTPTAGATPTAHPTQTAVAALRFSLDAARVSHVNNPGDLSGLVAVKPGTKVWLMMYFTVSAISKNMPRTTTYELQKNGKTFYRTTYKSTEKKSDGVGRFSRFDEYQVARTQPYGNYVLKVTLTMGTQSRTANWKFAVARQERSATTKQSKGH